MVKTSKVNEKGILHVGVIYLLCPKLKSNNVFGFIFLENGTHFNYKHDLYKQYSVKFKSQNIILLLLKVVKKIITSKALFNYDKYYINN